jgi:hypothetical protein
MRTSFQISKFSFLDFPISPMDSSPPPPPPPLQHDEGSTMVDAALISKGPKKGGRVPGSKGYTENETFVLLDLVGTFLPRHKSASEWEPLQMQYNKVATQRGWVHRDADSLRGRFHRLVHHNKKSEDPTCPRTVLQARSLYQVMDNCPTVPGLSQSSSSSSRFPIVPTPLPQLQHQQNIMQPIVIDEDSSDTGTEAELMPRSSEGAMNMLDCSLLGGETSSVDGSKKRRFSESSLPIGDMPFEKRPNLNLDPPPAPQESQQQTREEYYAELERQNAYYQTVNDMMAATIQLQQQQYQLQIQALMQAHVRLWNMAFNPFLGTTSLPVSPVGSQLHQISTPPPPLCASSSSSTNLRPEPPSKSQPCISPTESMFTGATHSSSHSLNLTDSDENDE